MNGRKPAIGDIVMTTETFATKGYVAGRVTAVIFYRAIITKVSSMLGHPLNSGGSGALLSRSNFVLLENQIEV
jgi:hypothetical protein